MVVGLYLWKLVQFRLDSCQVSPRSPQLDVQQRDGPHHVSRHRQPLSLEPVTIERNRELVGIMLNIKAMGLGQRKENCVIDTKPVCVSLSRTRSRVNQSVNESATTSHREQPAIPRTQNRNQPWTMTSEDIVPVSPLGMKLGTPRDGNVVAGAECSSKSARGDHQDESSGEGEGVSAPMHFVQPCIAIWVFSWSGRRGWQRSAEACSWSHKQIIQLSL